jgi:hypothetical protein
MASIHLFPIRRMTFSKTQLVGAKRLGKPLAVQQYFVSNRFALALASRQTGRGNR